MNTDSFIRDHELEWSELAALSAQVRRGPKKLSAYDRRRFIELYQLTSAHLSQVRTGAGDAALDHRLTRLVATANGALYGQQQFDWKAMAVFWRDTFPAAVWHLRRSIAWSAALLLVPWVAAAVWLGVSETAAGSIPPALAETYVNEDFEDYYSSEAATEFATQVFINNVRVSFLAFAGGIVFCVGTILVLVVNGWSIGTVNGLFADAGQLDRFFGLVLPHGLLEISAIIIAGGAGLIIGWSIIAPGDRTRSDALAEEARRAVVVVIGLVAVFLAAALIEGYVTGSALSTLVRVGIGTLAWAAFVLYIVANGRRAAAKGLTGLWGDQRMRWVDLPVEDLEPNVTVSVD